MAIITDLVQTYDIAPGKITLIPGNPAGHNPVALENMAPTAPCDRAAFTTEEAIRKGIPRLEPDNYGGYVLNCDPGLLFGELAWAISEYPATEVYVTEFLEIADYYNDPSVLDYDQDHPTGDYILTQKLARLLGIMEQDGYPINWDACKKIAPPAKIGFWKRMALKLGNLWKNRRFWGNNNI